MADFDFSTGYRYAGIIIFPLALFGFACNLGVVIFLRLMPSLNNPFGVLTLSQAVADCCHQLIFAFYLAPCIYLRSFEMYSLSEQAGFALLFFYEVCGLSHVCISTNRFVAVFAPITYSNLFKKGRTIVLICLYWIAAALLTLYMLKLIDCPLYLPQGHWIFAFKDTEICAKVMWYGDFLKNVLYVATVALLDLSTILRIHYLNRKHRYGGIGDAVSALRRSREMNLVYQTALQGIFFISELVTYFILSTYARNKWESFLLTTVAWCLVHGMDGFIVLSFNRDFRRQIKKTILPPEFLGNLRSSATRTNIRSLTSN